MSEFKAHLFVCTNVREKGQSCGGSGSAALRDELKKRCKEKLADGAACVRINASGCLGHCEKGITAVLYPKGEWVFHLKNDESSLEKLFDLVREQL